MEYRICSYTKHMTSKLLIFASALTGIGLLLYLMANDTKPANNEPDTGSKSTMTLTLAAPRTDDTYYQDQYEQILDFQIGYAQAVIDAGNDTVQIFADAETIARYGDQLPAGTFVEKPMLDIWMRDFSLVNPSDPVQFMYTDSSMSAREALATQGAFSNYLTEAGIVYRGTDLIIDGGNIVDDYQGRVITTTRFLEDNYLSMSDGKQQLREILGASEVAIIEPDDEALAHSDGMVAWIDDGMLAVNDYSQTDPEFHELVMNELEGSFTNVRFVLVPVVFDKESGADPNIGSACGVNLNYSPCSDIGKTAGK